ncbi:MAG: hypothetical protein KDC12_03250 [Flavobacteriales bacterium]|nr:hypothetical protein [Flavobacteriales bacterium]
MYIKTFTYGKVPVEVWEYPMLFLIIVVLFLLSGYIKRKHISYNSAYRYFLWGLWAKVIGGIVFGVIYTLYYSGGDTTSYYECALAFCNLFTNNFSDFVTAYIEGGTQEVKSIFTGETGSPLWYMFAESKTRMVIKLLVPFMLLGMKSYFLTTVLVSVATYGGLWKLYLMFNRYFPGNEGKLALAILFMPSVVFWGSGILKDSFTLALTCYFVVATERLISKHGHRVWNAVLLIVSGFFILNIKPYILMILLPCTLVWMFYARIRRIRNKFFRYIMVPFIYLVIILGSYGALVTMGDSLGKFAPERALKTAVVIQNDLKQEYYDGSSFDIGELEATPTSILSKFPQATVAGLYRPFLWESNNVVMLLSGLENLIILGITLLVLISIRWRSLWRIIVDNPIIMYCLFFSVMFAFMIGVTTSNFGALVRFKIPLIPLYMGTMVILLGQLRIHNSQLKRDTLN